MVNVSTNVIEESGDSEIMNVFERADDPVLTAVEIAEQLNITQQAAHARLSDLVESGEIERKTVGARAVVWWDPSQSPEEESR